MLVAILLLGGVLAFALSRLGLHRIGNALTSAQPGWIVLALALMGLSLLLRAASWHEVLRAALPETPIAWAPVIRATMIGVMASAVFPGRIGEPTRMLVLTRRLPGSSRRQLPIVAGTVFSQTLINLLALAILATVTFTSLDLLSRHVSGLAIALAVPLLICLLVLLGPPLLRLAQRSRSVRVALAAAALGRLLRLARQGLAAFANPRHGVPAVLAATARLDAAVARLLRRALRARPAVRRRSHRGRRGAARRQRLRRAAPDPLQRGRLPGRLPGRARRLRRRRRPRARLRDHPAGRRGPHRARPRPARAARRGHDLAGHP